MDNGRTEHKKNKKRVPFSTSPLDWTNRLAGNSSEFVQQIQNIRSYVSYAQKGASIFLNPYVVVGIIFIILVLFVTGQTATTPFSNKGSQNTSSGQNTNTNPVPGLTLNLSGPSQVQNGEGITYTISVSYSGTDAVSIIDPLPQNTSFSQATGVHNQDPNKDGQIVWELAQNASSTATNPKTYSFTLVLSPTTQDITISNYIYATSTSTQQTPPQNIASTSFDTLMIGQGRNTGILGDENNFTAVVLKNGSPQLFPSTAESYIRQIYETAIAKNVNPLIILTIWGVEHSFIIDNSAFLADAFSCPPRTYGGFSTELSCAVNSLNNQMNIFEQKKSQGTYPVPLSGDKTCYYTDPFLYAYEAYTPVCITNDGNDSARQNFVKIYKQLYGSGN